MFNNVILCIIYRQAETVALYLTRIFLSRDGPILHIFVHLCALEFRLITLSPVKRRLVYVTIFELVAVISSTFVLMLLSDSDITESLPVALMVSFAAVTWNFIYNTGFEAWERRRLMTQRSFWLRTIHAIGFEGGLFLICLPLYMLWYGVSLTKAFTMEATLLLFFLVYTFIFTLIFDKIFSLPQHYQPVSNA